MKRTSPAQWSSALTALLMAGAALLRFLASSEAAPAITKAGLTPVSPRRD